MLFFYNSSNNIITGNLGYVLKSIAGIDGEFEMKIPDSLFEEGNVSLTFSFTSYKSKRIIFSKEDFPLSIQIKLVPTALNGIVEKRFEDIENSKRTRNLQRRRNRKIVFGRRRICYGENSTSSFSTRYKNQRARAAIQTAGKPFR